jgi:hypothetical protein
MAMFATGQKQTFGHVRVMCVPIASTTLEQRYGNFDPRLSAYKKFTKNVSRRD